MKYLGYSINSGFENMKIDSDILENSIKNNSNDILIRLYGWKPMCVSLGRNQKEFSMPADINVVRRLTGGRALLHDNEITYCIVAPINLIPNGQSVTESYKYLSKIFIDFFKDLGINLDFGENKKISTNFDYCMLISTGADVCYKGKKLIGSAQCRKNEYILQHGSILYDYNKELLENLFNEKIEGITCIKEILPNITRNDLINLLVRHFQCGKYAETYQKAEQNQFYNHSL